MTSHNQINPMQLKPEPQRCGAKTRNGGKPCQNWGMLNKRCRMHGGKTPRGIASANWKHGRFSKYLPTGLRHRYEEELGDPELLALNDEIALLRSRLSTLLEKLDFAPDSGSTWVALRRELDQFESAQQYASGLPKGDARVEKMREVSQLFDQLKSTIKRGAAEWAAWREIITLTDQVKRLTESEQKRRVAGEHILGMHDVMALFDYMVNLINDIVSDPREKARISDGLIKLSRQMDGGRAVAEE